MRRSYDRSGRYSDMASQLRLGHLLAGAFHCGLLLSSLGKVEIVVTVTSQGRHLGHSRVSGIEVVRI
jgi:hypothetical protein